MTPKQQTPKKGQKTAALLSFADVETPLSTRILRIQNSQFSDFKGLKSYHNLRILDIKANSVQFDRMSLLVAFRSHYLGQINGEKVSAEDIAQSFKYSAVVTVALRNGMNPALPEDPEIALQDSIKFLSAQNNNEKFKYDQETHEITILQDADIYSWFFLDENFVWTNVSSNSPTFCSVLNAPMKCVTKAIKNETIVIPEYDHKYHFSGEIIGNPIEGGILSVKTSLSAYVTWRNSSDETLLSDGCFVLPLTTKDIGTIIACDIVPAPNLPKTRLLTPPIKPGEFRFNSLRMQGQMIEDDIIEFDVSTRGTKAVFKGVRILRSARYGEWENVTTLEKDQLSYRLTVNDIGCVIRAICLTEGGGPPLMLTSSERVQPSSPAFKDQMITGNGTVGSPLFAIALYKGGIQGKSIYEWNIGKETDRKRPVVVPTQNDVGRQAICKMTPIRSDGSIGKTVIATYPVIKENPENAPVMVERFLKFMKITKNGRLQLSFVDECPDQLFSVQEGKSIVISQEVDWAIVSSDMIHNYGRSKIFTAPSEYINSFVVLFTDDYFSLAGQIEAADPTIKNLEIHFEPISSILSTIYNYSGGIEGRTIVQWNRCEKDRDVPVSFGKTYHVNVSDANMSFKAIVTPVSIDGKKGAPVQSQPFLIQGKNVIDEEEPPLVLKPPESIFEKDVLIIATEKETIPKKTIKIVSSKQLGKREKVLWECGTKLLAEGIEFICSTADIDHNVTVRVIDRLSNRVVCFLELPKVLSLKPSIQNLTLSIGQGKTKNKMPSKLLTVAYDSYIGGIEGKPEIIWKAKKEGSDYVEITKSTRKWIEVDHQSFSGYKFIATVIPKDSNGNQGDAVNSNPISIPEAPKPVMLEIKEATIVIDKEYQHFTCQVQTNKEPGNVDYLWGYIVDGQEQYTDETSETREITEDDFDYPPFCRVTPSNPAGEKGEHALVFLTKTTQDLFVPSITCATISADGPIMIGTKCHVDVKSNGPPPVETSVVWKRLSKTGEWIVVSKNPVYIPNGNDLESTLCASVSIAIENHFVGERIDSEIFESEPFVPQPNPTIMKLATALRRSKAQFDAKLSIGDQVVILIENGFFIMKSKTNTLLKDKIPNVTATIIDEGDSRVEINAHHGYTTQLVFEKKKMIGGTKLSANLARELFVETLKRFRE